MRCTGNEVEVDEVHEDDSGQREPTDVEQPYDDEELAAILTSWTDG